MANIQLRTGKTIYMSVYEYFFKLDDEDMDLFYQSCEADDLGIEIEDPFSNRRFMGTLKEEDTQPDIPEDSILEEPNWDI